jgi:hypothetical protein
LLALTVSGKTASLARQQDADLLEQLANRGSGDRVGRLGVVGMDGASRKHMRIGSEVGSPRAPHQQ